MRRFASVAVAGILAVAGCSETLMTPGSDGPRFSIEDAVHNNGNPHFFWLPPMVSNPTYGGTFDATLSPVITICHWTGSACGALIAEFTTTSGAGSETVRLGDQHYVVNWHTDQFGLDVTKTYRIVASVGSVELGHADVDVVSGGNQLKNVDTNQFIPLVNGRTLPIKFRIETGALPSGVTIDATALTATAVDLRGPQGEIGFLPTAQPIQLPAAAGTYTIADRFLGRPIPFSITGSGTIDYAPQFDAIFQGRGGRTLTVTGHVYTIDATPVSAPFFQLAGIGHYGTGTPTQVTELPGTKRVQDGSALEFYAYELTDGGAITYDPAFEPFFDGQGTATLTLVGYEHTVDATGLSAPSIQLASIGHFPTSTPAVVRGLPGTRRVQEQSSPEFATYQLTTAGLIDYTAAVDAFADGAGTSTLTLAGFTIVVDATLMAAPSFSINGIGSFPSNVLATLALLPGSKGFTSTALTFGFTVDAAGLIDYPGTLDAQVSGRGTSTLKILN